MRDITIPLHKHTVIVGANGSGKSNLLKALDFFFKTDAKFNIEDFWSRITTEPIEIKVTFSQLTKEEKDRFREYVHDDKLTIKKEVSLRGDKFSQKYFGFTLYNPDFIKVRSAEDAEEVRKQYAELRKNYSELPEKRNKKDILDTLENWEKQHPDKCERTPKENQFFGYTNVGSGYLRQSVDFLLIPAVKEAEEESEEARGSELGKLIEQTVRSALRKNPEATKIEQETKTKYQEIMGGREMKNVEQGLNEKLTNFVPEARATLVVGTEEVDILSSFRVTAKLIEDGYETDVASVGHGTQRAFIMALLEHNAEQFSAKEQTSENTKTLVLAIEEPELYQHPSRQRHLSSVFEKLSESTGNLNFQVIYVTHSPLFVKAANLDNIVRFCKTRQEGESGKSAVAHTTLDECAKQLGRAYSHEDYTGGTLLPRLRAIMTPWMNEAFFAKAVVLVEGEDDRALLQGYSKAVGKDLDSMNTSVVPCYGKANIDRPLVILKNLKIPVYPVWDLDHDKSTEKQRNDVNDALLKLCNCKNTSYETIVGDDFACFETDFPRTVKGEMGSQLEEMEKQYSAQFEIEYKSDMKNPHILERAIEDCVRGGSRSNVLDEMIKRIEKLG